GPGKLSHRRRHAGGPSDGLGPNVGGLLFVSRDGGRSRDHPGDWQALRCDEGATRRLSESSAPVVVTPTLGRSGCRSLAAWQRHALRQMASFSFEESRKRGTRADAAAKKQEWPRGPPAVRNARWPSFRARPFHGPPSRGHRENGTDTAFPMLPGFRSPAELNEHARFGDTKRGKREVAVRWAGTGPPRRPAKRIWRLLKKSHF